MRILLGNTGRGGEQCIFTSIVHTYRKTFPDAYIIVATCPQYKTLWLNNQDINYWIDVKYQAEDKFPEDPINAFRHYMVQNKEKHDVIEYASECVSPIVGQNTLEKCYAAIHKKVFKFEDIERKVFIYPTRQDNSLAERLAREHPNMILISPGANCAKHPITTEGFSKLAKGLNKYGNVCYIRTTGRNQMPADPKIENAHEITDLSYGALYALAPYIKLFIGLDTATSWIVSPTKSPIITLRRDPSFSLQHTGLVAMGYRKPENTFEIELSNEYEGVLLQRIMNLIEGII